MADLHAHHERPVLGTHAEHDLDHQPREHDEQIEGAHVHGVPPAHGASALRVVVLSSLVLAVVAAVELTAAAVSGSAAVLADGLHNLGDVSTTVALAAAFILSRRAPTRRFPYGYHRGEDLAGLVVLGLIVASAVASGFTSVEHLVHPQPLSNVPIALATALVGFVGNEAVGQYKLRAGKRLSSMALRVDGQHSRLDGLVSLGAAVGVIGAGLGATILDPVAGLIITAVIAVVAWDTGRTVTARLLDAADASLVATIESVARSTPGVLGVTETRARWTGRRVRAEVTLELAPDATLAQAHALGEEVRHRLLHRVDTLTDVIVHLDPAGDQTAHQAVSHHLA